MGLFSNPFRKPRKPDLTFTDHASTMASVSRVAGDERYADLIDTSFATIRSVILKQNAPSIAYLELFRSLRPAPLV